MWETGIHVLLEKFQITQRILFPHGCVYLSHVAQSWLLQEPHPLHETLDLWFLVAACGLEKIAKESTSLPHP